MLSQDKEVGLSALATTMAGAGQAPLDDTGVPFATASNGDPGNCLPTVSIDQLNSGNAAGVANAQMNGGRDSAGKGVSQEAQGNGEGRAAGIREIDGSGTNTNGVGDGIGEGKEHGEINGDEGQKRDSNDAGDDMELEAPPKEDPIVDYTDEFGRVRTMRQRWAMDLSLLTYRHDSAETLGIVTCVQSKLRILFVYSRVILCMGSVFILA